MQHDEAGSTTVRNTVEAITAIRNEVIQYEPNDIYHAGQTALYWKKVPASLLATQRPPKVRLDKAIITLQLCCNATGSHQLDPWIIGKAEHPRAARQAHVDLNNLRCTWRWNANAWTTTGLIVEWLTWFDGTMHGRHVLLLMSNSPPNLAALEHINRQHGVLKWTTVRLLPQNVTFYQPLDHGIVENLKALYRKQWLSYILREADAGRDAIKTVNVLKAVRWVIDAWQDIHPETINRCWAKSTLFGTKFGPIHAPAGFEDERPCTRPEETTQEVNQLYWRITGDAGSHEEAEQLLDDYAPVELVEEAFFDNLRAEATDAQRDAETDEEDERQPAIATSLAIQQLNGLILYEEQQGDGKYITTLRRMQRSLVERLHASAQRSFS